jgi:hypothetical protein
MELSFPGVELIENCQAEGSATASRLSLATTLRLGCIRGDDVESYSDCSAENAIVWKS